MILSFFACRFHRSDGLEPQADQLSCSLCVRSIDVASNSDSSIVENINVKRRIIEGFASAGCKGLWVSQNDLSALWPFSAPIDLSPLEVKMHFWVHLHCSSWDLSPPEFPVQWSFEEIG